MAFIDNSQGMETPSLEYQKRSTAKSLEANDVGGCTDGTTADIVLNDVDGNAEPNGHIVDIVLDGRNVSVVAFKQV